MEYEVSKNDVERLKTMVKLGAWENLGMELQDDVEGAKKLVYNIARITQSNARVSPTQ